MMTLNADCWLCAFKWRQPKHEVIGGSERHIQNQADIGNVGPGQVFKHRDQVQEFVVVCVGEPAADRHGVLRVEDV
jgi:hypothetical protein